MIIQRLGKFFLGEAIGELMPERVKKRITQQQGESEILIGTVQLIVGVAICSLYLLAPSPDDTTTDFDIVPYTLVFYIIFTIFRLVLAKRNFLPDWLLAFSVILDMVLLFGLLWSFHIKYDESPTLYLKAPTLLYVFVFIALRALRFDLSFILLAGFSAIFGWAILVFLAADQAAITNSYVAYMHGAKLLIGAEVEKILAILLFTGVIGLAVVRARRLLVRSVAESAAAQDLSRFFAPEVAERIKASDNPIMPGTGEIRQASIMFCDIRGFSSFAKQCDPSQVMRMLADYESALVPIIQKHGGAVDKFMGDGIMATFGAAIISKTYAADVLRAGAELVQAAEKWSASRKEEQKLSVGFGIATGQIIFGALGDANRMEYTVIGDAVNLAAKLEKHNKTIATKSIASSETIEVARQQGYEPKILRILEKISVEGITQPINIVVLAD